MVRRPLLAGVPVLVASALLALVAGCGEGVPVSQYELSGIVSERFESGMALAPLAGVHITFRSDTGLVFETDTGGDGRYRLRIESDVAFGQVRAELAGFQPTERTVYFDTNSRRIDLDMRRETGSM